MRRRKEGDAQYNIMYELRPSVWAVEKIWAASEAEARMLFIKTVGNKVISSVRKK